MRLRPPSWIVVRDVLREDTLPSGARLAPGARVYASQWVTHRDPRLHPDPERFDPERFLDGGPARRAVYAYFPFGAGPRDCIGRGLAMLEGCARPRTRRPARLLRAAGTAAAARRRDGAPARRRVADGRAPALRARFTRRRRWETLTRMRRPKLALLLVAGALALVAAGCGGDDDSDTAEPPAATTTENGGGETGDAANGEQVYVSAGCGGCHTFEAAGSTGSVGPNLDDASPSFDLVVDAGHERRRRDARIRRRALRAGDPGRRSVRLGLVGIHPTRRRPSRLCWQVRARTGRHHPQRSAPTLELLWQDDTSALALLRDADGRLTADGLDLGAPVAADLSNVGPGVDRAAPAARRAPRRSSPTVTCSAAAPR